MRLLLDTHVFLWYITAESKLPPTFRDAIRDSANDVYLSAASVWEAVIKHTLGKLPLPAPAAEYMCRQRAAHDIASLAIDEEAMSHLAGLAPLHRDPFDRLLIAQAVQHGMTIVSVDPNFAAYPISMLPPA